MELYIKNSVICAVMSSNNNARRLSPSHIPRRRKNNVAIFSSPVSNHSANITRNINPARRRVWQESETESRQRQRPTDNGQATKRPLFLFARQLLSAVLLVEARGAERGRESSRTRGDARGRARDEGHYREE